MRALVVLLLAGCWHDVPPPQMPTTETTAVADDDPPITWRHRRPGGPDCSSLVPVMEQIFNRTGFQNQMEPILDAVTASCTEDAWSMELVQCFIDASDDRRVNDCANLLTPEQTDRFRNRLTTAMTLSVSPPPSVPPPSP